jgi:4-hydroxybenzoate polyprenyltransferase
VALLAGGTPELAARIGLAMTLLQLGIGAVNDVVDAPTDAGHKPGKPIPSGLVAADAARAVAVALLLVGTVLAATVGPALVALSLVVISIGLAYDLRLKGTAWSWLPFAVGIPILPVYGWVGATGALPAAFAVLVPAAVAAGAALAIGNSVVDVERDVAAGRTSVAASLGLVRASGIACGLFAMVGAAAIATAWLAGASAATLVGLLLAGAVPVAACAVAAGRSPADREWAWRAEAAGVAAVAILWIGAVLA